MRNAASLLFLLVTPCAWAQSVLFVLSDSNVEGNQSVVDRLTNEFGLNVTVIDDDTPRNPVASDAEGMSLVVISSTVLSGNVGTVFTDQDPTFRAMEIPTIQWEQALHDEFLFADSGTNATGDTITITDLGSQHPLGAGLNVGDHLVRDGTTEFHLASLNNLAPDFETIAEFNGVAAIGVVEAGGTLKDGSTTASAKRIDMFWGDSAIDGATEAGLQLFDAAINYAIGFDRNVTLGDFNSDGLIDLADLNIQLENMNTTMKSFEDGDMDFNRRVNLADFLAFRQVFNAQPAATAAVPEPSAGLLAAGGALLLLGRRRKTPTTRS